MVKYGAKLCVKLFIPWTYLYQIWIDYGKNNELNILSFSKIQPLKGHEQIAKAKPLGLISKIDI